MAERSHDSCEMEYQFSSEDPKENIKTSSTSSKHTPIDCNLCKSECKWLKQKSSDIPEKYKCDICSKNYTNPSRYYCGCEKSGYNVCAQCSQIATKEKCGCEKPLVFETDLIRYCCWCDSQIKEKGWKCSGGCKYAICLYCEPRIVVGAATKKSDPSNAKSTESPKIPEPPKTPLSPVKKYKKLNCLGHGTFGFVYRCMKIETQVLM